MAKMASGIVFNDYVPGCDYIGEDDLAIPVSSECRVKFYIRCLKEFIHIEWITNREVKR